MLQVGDQGDDLFLGRNIGTCRTKLRRNALRLFVHSFSDLLPCPIWIRNPESALRSDLRRQRGKIRVFCEQPRIVWHVGTDRDGAWILHVPKVPNIWILAANPREVWSSALR